MPCRFLLCLPLPLRGCFPVASSLLPRDSLFAIRLTSIAGQGWTPIATHPLARKQATARELDRALQRPVRAHRDFRRNRRLTSANLTAHGWTKVGNPRCRGCCDRHTRRDQPGKDIQRHRLRLELPVKPVVGSGQVGCSASVNPHGKWPTLSRS